MAYGLDFEWVENDPTFVDGFVYLRLKGVRFPTIFASIKRQWKSGIINRKYYYVLNISNRSAADGRPIGGYYDSLAEAKDACRRMMRIVFEDPRDQTITESRKD
jgi:hypothetical protein